MDHSIFGNILERPILVMVIDPKAKGAINEEIVQAVFGVTNTEAKLACALASGMSANEFADEKQVSRNTVRVQTQSLLNKMGARRQSEVTNMLATAFSHLRRN